MSKQLLYGCLLICLLVAQNITVSLFHKNYYRGMKLCKHIHHQTMPHKV